MRTTTPIREDELRTNSTASRQGSRVKFTIPTHILGDNEPEDVMMVKGFHPAGYGSAFDQTTEGENTVFYCWGSSD